MRHAIVLFVLVVAARATAAHPSPSPRELVCDRGVLRWSDTGEEAALFGVNYYAPHWQNYLDLGTLGVDRDETIRNDLTHLRRLRLDLIRIHVFDREISDRDGNLRDNEHLRLLDRLIAEGQGRGIAFVLTPIAWWATPNAGDGFSNDFSMPRMTTDKASLPAQRNYLRQFLMHRNRYTGLTFAEDRAVVAIELINEPQYSPGTTDAQVTAYIDELAGAVRATGSRKPIFYNGWGGHLNAVGRSTADGCTFGWYPSGLASGHAVRRNFLGAVADYPEMRSPALGGKARGVYEFDAADIPGSYIYPAMARSFRSGGAQFAAQFQYDPLPLARFNAGWQTHYLNLVYAPGKTLSFMIAGEAFRALPRLGSWGSYPESNAFGPTVGGRPSFRVSFEDDLSEAVTATAFLHSNNTHSRPPAPERLERVAGVGSSPVVEYNGTGAYFLDRLSPGQWRLEVYPDAVWVNDPFGRDSLTREVSRVIWRERLMRVHLPDLGPRFSVRGVEAPDTVPAAEGAFKVTPGVYLLRREGLTGATARLDPTFVAPKPRPGRLPAVWHDPPRTWISGKPLPLHITVATEDEPRASVVYRSKGDWKTQTLSAERPYQFIGTLPGDDLRAGALEYRVVVDSAHGPRSYPQANVAQPPLAGKEPVYSVPVQDANAPIRLFSGDERVRTQGDDSARQAHVSTASGPALRVSVPRFGPPPASVSFRLELDERLRPWQGELAGRGAIRLKLRAGERATSALELVVLETDGSPWGCNIPLTGDWQEVRVPWDRFRHFAQWAGPADRGRPGDRFHPENLNALNVCFGAWLFPETADRPHAVEIEGIWLDR